jgi:hypothetical protein
MRQRAIIRYIMFCPLCGEKLIESVRSKCSCAACEITYLITLSKRGLIIEETKIEATDE